MTAPRDFDLVLFGATGFTGKLVAEHLARRAHAGSGPPLRWAIAGRSREKLAALGLDVPILVADAHDPVALAAVARRAAVVCSTVGPYGLYGSELVAACAAHGTDYCDLTAEVPWMRAMIDRHDAAARASGARIVHACGYDSVPSDLGTMLAQRAFAQRFGRPAERVTGFFAAPSGGVSGGTIASAMTMAKARKDPAVRAVLDDPYALDPRPGEVRPPAPDVARVGFDRRLGVLTAPFVMAPSNTRIVRRSHVLAGEPWGKAFTYREVMGLPRTPRGAALAVGLGLGGIAFRRALGVTPLRKALARVLPKPGEGPSESARDHGHWRARFLAEGGEDRVVFELGDDKDPGYASTARMIGEAALALARDRRPEATGGFLTPAVALGDALAARLAEVGFVLREA